MNDSKGTALKKALQFIKENRKRFYKLWWSRWAVRCIMSDKDHDWYQQRNEFKDNPELGALSAMIWYAFEKMGFEDNWLLRNEDFKAIIDKYQERFANKYIMFRVKEANGIFPHENKTKAIKELLVRGWVHEDEVNMDKTKYHYVICHIAPLVWPGQWETHSEAIDIMSRYGIPGYCGTTLIKSK